MRRLLFVAVLLAVLGLGTSPAAANFPVSVDNTVAPGGYGYAASASLPAGAGSATVQVSPKTDADRVIGKLTAFLDSFPTFGARVVQCVLLSTAPDVPGKPFYWDDDEESTTWLFLTVCIHLAQELGAGTASPRAAAAGCRALTRTLSTKVTRTSSGYHIHAQLTKRRRPAVRVSCRRRGRSIVMKVRSRRRGKPLRKLLGERLQIGFTNPGTKPLHVHTTFSLP